LGVYAELGALAFLDDLGDDRVVRPRILPLDGCPVAVGGFTPRLDLPADVDPLDGVSYAETTADVRILVVHGVVEGTLPPAVTSGIIRRATIARLSGAVDLLIVGDVHRPDAFSCGDVTVVIPGATERLTFGDAYSPGYAWIEAEPGHVTALHEPVTPQPRLLLTLPADALDPDDPTGWVLAQISPRADSDALARVAIEGALPREVYRRLNPALLEEHGRRAFFAFDLDLTRLALQLDRSRDIFWTPRRTAADEVRAVVASLCDETSDPEERAILDDARAEILDALADEGEEIDR
jgi:DNA repair exonuclease SbcCD nuclease subunit